MSMAGWGLDKEVLGGSGVPPAYPQRPSLAARLAEAWRILAYRPALDRLPEPRPVVASVSQKQRIAQPG
jgi:hypothetical protein